MDGVQAAQVLTLQLLQLGLRFQMVCALESIQLRPAGSQQDGKKRVGRGRTWTRPGAAAAVIQDAQEAQ